MMRVCDMCSRAAGAQAGRLNLADVCSEAGVCTSFLDYVFGGYQYGGRKLMTNTKTKKYGSSAPMYLQPATGRQPTSPPVHTHDQDRWPA